MSSFLNYQMIGEGPPLVLLHGFMENMSMWDKITKELSKDFRCILIDLPGHGKSQRLEEDEDITIAQMAVKIHDLLEKIEVDTAHLVGHSMGGYVGLAFQRLFPQHCSSLSLYHSKASADSKAQKVNRDRGIEVLRKRPMDFIGELIRALFIQDKDLDLNEEIEDLIREAKKGDPEDRRRSELFLTAKGRRQYQTVATALTGAINALDVPERLNTVLHTQIENMKALIRSERD